MVMIRSFCDVCGIEINMKNNNVIPSDGYKQKIPYPSKDCLVGIIHMNIKYQGGPSRKICKNCFITKAQEKLQELTK
jgi:hypothetical protein